MATAPRISVGVGSGLGWSRLARGFVAGVVGGFRRGRRGIWGTMISIGAFRRPRSMRPVIAGRRRIGLGVVVWFGRTGGERMTGRIVSVFGPFNSRALVEVSAEDAMRMVDADELDACGRGVIDAIDGELAELRTRAPDAADSATAAAARSLAFELENPYNSLTSKAMATRELRESMSQLHALAPPKHERDGLDDIAAQRAKRRAGGAGT